MTQDDKITKQVKALFQKGESMGKIRQKLGISTAQCYWHLGRAGLSPSSNFSKFCLIGRGLRCQGNSAQLNLTITPLLSDLKMDNINPEDILYDVSKVDGEKKEVVLKFYMKRK